MIIWWHSHLRNNTNREKNMGIVQIAFWIWMTSVPEDGNRDVPHTGRIWGHTSFVKLLLFGSSFFFFLTIIFCCLEMYCTFSSLHTVKNALTHLKSPKSIPDDSSTAKASRTWASHFICIVTLQLPPPTAHMGIRYTETTGSSKKCSALISQIIF